MKFLAVCGFGVGSSLILKMSIDKALGQLNVDGEVENIDLTTAKGMPCDAIFTSKELAEDLKSSVSAPVLAIEKYMDVEEVKSVLSDFLTHK